MAHIHFLSRLQGEGAPPAMTLAVEGRTDVIATTVEGAFDLADRLRGLLGRESLAPGTALIIAPCSAVHTFAMQFPIDVIFAARDGRVLKIRPALGPGTVAQARRAFAAIEIAAGEAQRHGVQVGDRLEIRRFTSSAAPLQRV